MERLLAEFFGFAILGVLIFAVFIIVQMVKNKFKK